MPGEKAKDFKGTIAKLVRFMGQFKVSLAVAIVFAIFSAAFSIVGPKVLSQATTELFNGIVAKIGGTGASTSTPSRASSARRSLSTLSARLAASCRDG